MHGSLQRKYILHYYCCRVYLDPEAHTHTTRVLSLFAMKSARCFSVNTPHQRVVSKPERLCWRCCCHLARFLLERFRVLVLLALHHRRQQLTPPLPRVGCCRSIHLIGNLESKSKQVNVYEVCM